MRKKDFALDAFTDSDINIVSVKITNSDLNYALCLCTFSTDGTALLRTYAHVLEIYGIMADDVVGRDGGDIKKILVKRRG